MLPDAVPATAWTGLRPERRLAGGARAEVWLARDSAGAGWVLKSTAHSEAALEWLAPLHAAARAAGLAVPALCRHGSGRLAPGGWSCEPFIAGRPGSAADLAALAPRLATFHAAARALPPRPGLPGVAEGAPRPADLPPELATALLAAFAPMVGAPTGAIHGDLNPGNLIVAETGPALLDWDESRRDWLFLDEICTRTPSPSEARAALAVETLACWGPEPARAQALTQRLFAAP